MDPYSFLRNLESRTPFLNGLNGLNPLSTLSGLNLDLPVPTDVRGKGKIAREEAALETKIVQKIATGDWESLKPNTGKAISIGDHHICVAYHEDRDSGYRIWEWHGHLLMFDDEEGYSPEYIYGNHFQPLEKKPDDGESLDNGGQGLSAIGALGLSGIIPSNDKKKRQPQHSNIVHRSGSKNGAVVEK